MDDRRPATTDWSRCAVVSFGGDADLTVANDTDEPIVMSFIDAPLSVSMRAQRCYLFSVLDGPLSLGFAPCTPQKAGPCEEFGAQSLVDLEIIAGEEHLVLVSDAM